MSFQKNWQELHLLQYDDCNYDLILIDRFYKNKLFQELLKERREESGEKITSDDEIQRIDSLRAKRKIRAIALCNHFEYFSTITVNSRFADRYSLEECELQLKKILHKLHRQDESFAYVIIIEKHKDGAFHFHGLTKNFPLGEIYENEHGYFSCHSLDNLGFNSFLPIKSDYQNNYDYKKVVTYVSKYIVKDQTKSTGNQLYFCSRGLLRPIRHRLNLSEFSMMFPNFKFDYDDEHCSKISFDTEKISDNDIVKGLLFLADSKENLPVQILNDKLLY